LNTPLIRSVTKRGNDTALSTLRVMPAMRSAEVPNPGASCARASGARRCGGAAASIATSASTSSAISAAASALTLTIAWASARCPDGSISR
jgi:hypothetical protein